MRHLHRAITPARVRLACVALCLMTGATAPWPALDSRPAEAAQGTDALPIARVLTDPGAFNLDVVTLVGTIREIRATHSETECGERPGAIVYLRDETGELPIINQGTCSDGAFEPPIALPFARGERVTVRAAIVQTPAVSASSASTASTTERVARASPTSGLCTRLARLPANRPLISP